LENKGVPLKVIGYEVWAYINSQYHDAIKVIRNPSHNVKKAVNLGDLKIHGLVSMKRYNYFLGVR